MAAASVSASRVTARYLDAICGPVPRIVVAANLKALKPNDWLTVYHGTTLSTAPELLNGFDATKVKKRHYGGPRHKGLFVTPTFDTARNFAQYGPTVLEMVVRAKNLHGTDYSGVTGRDDPRREDIWRDKYPDSFRPYLSQTLEQGHEPQALLQGLVAPRQIKRVWHAPSNNDPGQWYSRKEFLDLGLDPSANPRDKQDPLRDLGIDLSYPNYDYDEFIEALGVAYGKPGKPMSRERIEKTLAMHAEISMIPGRSDTLLELIERAGFQGRAAQRYADRFRETLAQQSREVAASASRVAARLMARTAREDLVKEVIDPSKVKFKIRSSSDAVAVEMRYGRKRIGQMIANKVRYPEEQDCPRDVTVLAKRFPELVTGEWKRSNGEVWRYITALSVYKAFITEDEFRGYGLGKKMYKALMGAWFKEVGPFLFMPSKCNGSSASTSSDAMRVWHSLAKEFPSSGDVVAVMKNPRVARGQLPQYRKRAHTPDSSAEVENWVEDFGYENNYTPGTCDLNRGDCDMMSNVFADWFEDQTGVGLQLWGGQGFIPPLGKDANDLWIMLSGDKAHKKGEKPLSHVVVVWGDWVIDLTGRQFGSKYKAPVYPLSEFKKRWASVGRARRADRGINKLRRLMLQNSSEW